MAKYGKAFKRAVQAYSESMEPGGFAVAGLQVACPHCGGVEFARQRIYPQMKAHALACTGCSRIEWFGNRPARL